ncbi:MAG: S8 family serine peptidase [Candidatus Dormibacteraeota bacterium]|uniref:S8 family serine peptidase n=1 Tax=Candidatus Amunia macphersoniae TaxID=3127014 RepID=A0A934KMS1_9BACT|nr:S8 family serine peptidase [Candidatus Dormibacteraeota bacterium]
MPHRPRKLTACFVVLTAALAGCASATSTNGPSPRPARVAEDPSRPSLAAAIRLGRDLGPIAADQTLTVSLGLQGRDQAALAALVARGGRVTPAQYAQRFGPAPTAVAAVVATLSAAGLHEQWQAGQPVLSVSGPAGAIERTFSVAVHNHIGPDGTRFHAPTHAPTVPASLAPEVTSVAGLQDYPTHRTQDLTNPSGFRPTDAADFYDVAPLQKAGLNGTGQTIYLVEIDEFGAPALQAYASKFNLPPFDVTVKRDPTSWGDPGAEGNSSSETDLDLEIIHGIAPMAKLVVYYASGKGDNVDKALRALVQDHPASIVTISLGQCEASVDPAVPPQDDAATTAAAASGTTIFVSSGDRGAYECIPNGDNNTVSPNYISALPSVTSVGGTTVYMSATGGYGRESAWGEPAEQWGSGGGNSKFFKLPAWQTGPGVKNQFSDGSRQQPDVAANADSLSGWDIFGSQPGAEGTVGGTSAAAPFWAALTALVDQNLAQLKLPSVGFANPPLYAFAQNPSGLPANPFHDIVTGTNLLNPATPGWDYATGLGSPDAGALADDFEWYEKNVAPH